VESEIATHVHHLSPNPNLSLPPVKPSRQLSSSPIPPAPEKQPVLTENASTPREIEPSKEQGSSMRSASSMQTPPPTSSSASKRKAQQAQVAKLVKESAANGGRKTTRIFPKPSNAAVSMSPGETSPQQFSTLQFSPEVFGSFPMAGPATAPVYPQQKLFWDPHQESNAMNIDFGTTDTFADSFGLDVSKQLDSFVSTHDLRNMSQIVSTSFEVENVLGMTMSATAPAAHDTNYLSNTGLIIHSSCSKPPNTAVDPSLLFSSPSRAPEPLKVDIPHQAMLNDNLQPYAHQIRDARRERESSETRKPKRRRGPPTESPAVKAALETLRGEEEDRSRGSAKAGISVKAFGGHADGNRVAFEEPEPSSVVRHRSTSVRKSKNLRCRSSSRQHPKRTVTLSIGPDGRAETQTQIIAEANSESQMDLDSDSGDTESLSSNDGDAHIATSQPSSFAYPLNKASAPRLAGFASSSKHHSQKSFYASKQSNVIDPALTTSFIYGPLSESKGTESEGETVMDLGNERGDAQSELKKVVKNRAQRRASEQLSRPQSGRDTLENRNRHPDNAYATHQALTPTQDMFHNISPTTITDPDLATPSSARDGVISGNATRCVCHSPDADGELMILW